MSYDTWQTGGSDSCLKCQVQSSNCWRVEVFFFKICLPAEAVPDHVSVQMFLNFLNMEWEILQMLLSLVKSWLTSFLHYLVTVCWWLMLSVALQAVHTDYLSFWYFLWFLWAVGTVGTLDLTFAGINNLGRLNKCVYHITQASTPEYRTM